MGILDALEQALADPMIIWGKVAGILGNVAVAALLLVAGHFIGKLLASIVSKLLNKVGLDKLSEKAGLSDGMMGASFSLTPSVVLGKIIYWLVFLTFIISAADKLGLETVSATINNFVLYLPKVIGAFLVVIIGLFVAGLVRTGIETALAGLNLGYEKALGGIVYAVIVIVVLSLGVNQLEIETDLFNQVVVIFLMAGAGAVALALGLGTRDVAGNVVAGVYARELYQPDDMVKVGEVTGTVVAVTSTSLVLQTEAGTRLTIPNSRLLDEQVEILS
ncbi:conserved cytoplasmic membrane protein, CmpX protein [gamma proteobacterium IMCC1989]|nr:conserved cytoplasmic membrane protein, CmpX protein [gamma proteobacterium IMCC1989]